MSTLTTKIYVRPGNEVRRLELNPDVDTLQSIQAKLKDVHETSPLHNTTKNIDFLFQYLDDENEWITVTTEEEWKVALKVGAAAAIVDPRAILRIKCNLIRRTKPVSEPHRAPPQRFPINHLFAPPQRIQARPERCQRFLSRPCPFVGQCQQTQEKKESFDLDNLINSVLGAFFVEPQEKKNEDSSNKGEKVETEQQSKTEEKVEVNPVEDPKAESLQECEPTKEEQLDEDAPIIESIPEQQERQEEVQKESEAITEDSKEQEFEYPAQLASLIAMGFTNEDFNKFLLRKNHGDITKVVAQLLEL